MAGELHPSQSGGEPMEFITLSVGVSMKRLSSILALGVLLVFVFVTGALAGPVASSSKAHPSAVGTYWTAERMRAAKPMPMPKVDRSVGNQTRPDQDANPKTRSNRGPAGSSPPYCPDCDENQFLAPTVAEESDFNLEASCPASYYYTYADTSNTTYPERVMGKIFFTAWGEDMVCSGALVGQRVVLTASHCVCDEYGWYDNVMFVPRLPGRLGALWPGLPQACLGLSELFHTVEQRRGHDHPL